MIASPPNEVRFAFKETILYWHCWKDEKPKERRCVLLWFAGDREYERYRDIGWYTRRCSSNPTLWAYLPTAKEMVKK